MFYDSKCLAKGSEVKKFSKVSRIFKFFQVHNLDSKRIEIFRITYSPYFYAILFETELASDM